MKRLLMIGALALALCIPVLGQKGRTGATCGDGENYARMTAEYLAWQAAEQTCWNMGGTSSNTHITYSGCSIFTCRATACTTCNFN